MRFWDASGVALQPLYKLSTAGLFQTDCEHADSLAQATDDDWPPFRKVGPSPSLKEPGPGSAPVSSLHPTPQVGCFDPYSDDPRLGVQKVALCKYTAQMVVAGTAGQVSLGCSQGWGSWRGFWKRWDRTGGSGEVGEGAAWAKAQR